MHTIAQLEQRVAEGFSEIALPGSPAGLYDPMHYTLALGGKRLRPLLVLAACDLFGGNIEDAVSAAVGIELFHNFTLLHDDLMDQAPLRRGRETVYRKWNANIAILSGDAMFALANRYVLNSPPAAAIEVAQVFNQTAIEVCEGQQLDMDFETTSDVTLNDYMQMIRLKTAVLLAASLKTGAIIARASQAQCEGIYRFGINLGLAFQIEDDLLDVYGQEATFGKVQGGDIVAGKKTFLYFAAVKQLAGNADEFIKLYSETSAYDKHKIDAVKVVFDEYDIRQRATAEIEKYVESAISELDLLGLPAESTQLLAGLATRLKSRSS